MTIKRETLALLGGVLLVGAVVIALLVGASLGGWLPGQAAPSQAVDSRAGGLEPSGATVAVPSSVAAPAGVPAGVKSSSNPATVTATELDAATRYEASEAPAEEAAPLFVAPVTLDSLGGVWRGQGVSKQKPFNVRVDGANERLSLRYHGSGVSHSYALQDVGLDEGLLASCLSRCSDDGIVTLTPVAGNSNLLHFRWASRLSDAVFEAELYPAP